jgi:maleamate amidohydrolase
MSDAGVYRKQQLGRNTGLGKRPALLAVDFVNGFHDPEILGGGNIAEAVIKTIPLLDFFRGRGLPVIFTRIVYAEDGSDASLWCKKVPRLRDLTERAYASQVVDALASRPGEVIIRKTQASAFFATHLGACLTAKGIDSLVVAGCTTSGCVPA